MDIPKVYLRARGETDIRYDVVDGQQRLRAIWDFMNGEFALKYTQPLQPVGSCKIDGRTFDKLSKKLRERLETFEVSIAIIKSAEITDITLLFGRLQMGAQLNPAELRNAILCPMRNEVDVTGWSSEFFKNSRISAARMKYQDFTAHAYALAIHGSAQDLKAPQLRQMYENSTAIKKPDILKLSQRVDAALDVLAEVNEKTGKSITQKWMFCDLMLFTLNAHRKGRKINTEKMAELYKVFEKRRLFFIRDPEGKLHDVPERRQKLLRKYAGAFRADGGRRQNLETRESVVSTEFSGALR